MDVSFATAAGAVAGDWSVLTTIPDYWSHLQASQTNFSIPIVVPDLDCDACVFRVRYSPNKPTEVSFWQCADVTIAKTGTPSTTGSVFGFLASQNPVSRRSIGIYAAGIADSGLPLLLSSAPSDLQLVDGVPAALGGKYYALGRNASTASAGAPALLLVTVDPEANTLTYAPITLPAGDASPPGQWTTLSAVAARGQLAVVGIAPAAGSIGKFVYQARTVDPASGAASAVIALSVEQDTFVNVLTATDAAVDPSSGAAVFYMLNGDENSLYALNAQVFTITLPKDGAGSKPTVMVNVTQDNSEWTLTNLHLEESTGRLLAVSPGLYSNTTWHLVEVSPSTGKVTPVGPVTGADEGIFASWYGGAMTGTHPDGTVKHLFQHALDGSFALATLDSSSGALLQAPTLLSGVNGEVGVTSLVYVGGAKASG